MNTPLNFSGVSVILDDSKVQTVEQLDFWIVKADDEEPEVDPDPEE